MSGTEGLRLLPKVDQVMLEAGLATWLERLPRELVRRVVQDKIEALRADLRHGGPGLPGDRDTAQAGVARSAARRLEVLSRPTLVPVINATGVVLHTNLGRAPLSAAAVEAVCRAAVGYTNLEYDLEKGVRSSRMDHVAQLMAHLFGCEAAMAVNNNAAAVLLAIDTLGAPGVIVSRGELVEIGDSFRLPDILARARVPIHEIGTTNRTTPSDYEAAIPGPGCVLLKVHRSNFAVKGFTREASIAELAEVARRRQAILVYDLGAGSIDSLEAHGLAGEPDVRGALRDGADLVTMSGDKLLGGPQAGILAGRAEWVQALRRNPLARALRIDKLTLAALQATLLSYASKDGAQDEVPTLRLILSQPEEIEARARRLLRLLESRLATDLEVAAGTASIGGGSFADLELPSFEVRLSARGVRATTLQARLRRGNPAVVARIKDETIGLDLRCVSDEEVEPLARAVIRAWTAGEAGE